MYMPEEQCARQAFDTSDLFEDEVPDTAPEELPGLGSVSESDDQSNDEDYHSEEKDKDSD